MKYEDFPILNNSEYSFMFEQYSKTKTITREPLVNQICNEITICLNTYWTIEPLYNNKISNAVKKCNQTLTRHLDNLTSLFNIQTSSTKSITTLNLFGFMQKINNIITLSINWFSNEEKEYYKTLSKKTIEEIISCTNEILSSMEDSNINFYKHM